MTGDISTRLSNKHSLLMGIIQMNGNAETQATRDPGPQHSTEKQILAVHKLDQFTLYMY